LSEFDCPPDCDYLGNESFYQESQQEKELRKLLSTVPSGQFDDIFRDSKYAEIAYAIEKNTAATYADGIYSLTDEKVKDAYYETYRMLKIGENLGGQDLSRNLRDLLLDLERQKKWKRDDIGLVLLRLIISVKRMSGKKLGPFSYLNYIRNNVLKNNSASSQELKQIAMKYFHKSLK
jgi:hypothetical protein